MSINNSKKVPMVPVDLVRDAQDSLVQSLTSDLQFSTDPDPTGQLNLSDEQKKFLKAYVDFRSIPTAAQIAGIDEKTGMDYFYDPICRSEIRRINLALYYRKFSRRLLSVDEIGGYLTSLLIDEDISESDRLTSKDKLSVVKLIIDLNKLKSDAYKNPKIIENVSFVEEEIKDLSMDDLKKLINETVKPGSSKKEEQKEEDLKKDELIAKINSEGYLDGSEVAYLKSCSIEQLEKLLEGEPIKNGEVDDT